MFVKITIFLTVVFFNVNLAYAEVYKNIDSQGRVYYGDKPLSISQKSGNSQNTNNNKKINNAQKIVTFKRIIPYPIGFKLKIKDLFLTRNYKKLNSVLQDYHDLFVGNPGNEDLYLSAYEVFKEQVPLYEKMFMEWIKYSPDDYQPYLARAFYYYNMGWVSRGNRWSSETGEKQFDQMNMFFSKSNEDLIKVMRVYDKSVLPYFLFIRMASVSGNDHKLRGLLDSGNKISPASYWLRFYYLKAHTPRWGGSYEQMDKIVKEALQHKALNKRFSLLEGFVYEDAGDMEALANRYNVAEKLYDKALQFGENHVALFKRGKNRYRNKQYRKSLSDLDRAILLYPDSAEYYYWRSKTHAELKSYTKSVKDIKYAYKLNEYDEYTNKYIKWLGDKVSAKGYDYHKTRKYKQALEKYDLVIDLSPNRADVYNWRARLYIDMNKLDSAKHDVNKAINLDPENFDYYLLMDWLLARKGRWDDIITYWDKFIFIDPLNSRAYVERAGAYYKKGDLKMALRNAKKSADMGNQQGKEAYKKIKRMIN